MKTLCLQLMLLILFAGTIMGENVPSPNGAYVLEIGTSARILDHGNPVLTVVSDLQGVRRLDVKWSPDSSRVVFVTNYDRGCNVYAAYREGVEWHRTIELDADSTITELGKQAGASGRLVSDKRTLGDWLDADRISVTGQLTFSPQQYVAFGYTLIFAGGPTQLSGGGFEDGAIKGVNFHVQ
jgi:hypothetical protein